jgi:hypothetical protein
MAAQNRDYLRIFLGSPGDVNEEREAVYRVIKEVEDLLRIYKDYYPGLSVLPLRALGWEQVPPGVGLPNEVILERFPVEESDIFIFILWKRFGSPPGTSRKGGGKFSSGTEEEFETAYVCNLQNQSGKPFIMVYQKKDEFSIANLSPREIGQYKKVVEFMQDCWPTGKHPVLTRSFISKDFESLLRRDLMDTVLKLSTTKVSDQGQGKQQAVALHDAEIGQEPAREENPSMLEWLKKNNLSANPFKHYVAEREEDLIKYYVPFKGLPFISNDIVSSNKNWLFFGVEGSGKTALKQFIASRCAPSRASMTLAVSYENSDFLDALTHTQNVDDILLTTCQQIFQSVLKATKSQAKYGFEIRYLQEPAAIFLRLGRLLEELGYKHTLCLLDLTPEVSESALSKLIEVLARLVALTPENVSFRLFLPKSLQVKFMRQGKYLGKCDLHEIRWEDKELKELIKQRMIYYSINKLNSNQALGLLCESRGKTGSIDDDIVKLSEGNPRAMIWLANQLFLEHCQSEPVPLKIEPRTWDRVQLDWWTTGRNLILGATGRAETFFSIGNDVYFNNKALKLSKRSKALLKRLVDAEGQTCSKEELIRTGWPDVRSEGVTEAALREAVRRLKGELKEKNKIDPAWVDTQHDQGYRLLEPESGNEKR